MATDAERSVLNHSGIYAIVCEPTGKRYVGQAANLQQRWIDHRKTLRKNRHTNRYLQRAFNKYGEGSFSFVILETCAPADLTAREQHWIDSYSWGRLFNLSPTAQSTRGVKYSEAAKANLRAAAKRKKPRQWTDAERAALGKRSRERVWTLEMRAKLSAAISGTKRSAETRAKFSEMRRGKPATPGSRKALLKAARSKRSPAIKEKMSRAWKLIWAARKANGYQPPKHTPEQIARMCIAQKKAWIMRKQKRWERQLCLPI